MSLAAAKRLFSLHWPLPEVGYPEKMYMMENGHRTPHVSQFLLQRRNIGTVMRHGTIPYHFVGFVQLVFVCERKNKKYSVPIVVGKGNKTASQSDTYVPCFLVDFGNLD